MLGVLVGISLLTTGISVMMLAIAARHVVREATLDQCGCKPSGYNLPYPFPQP